jgi:hypothetical protein
MGGRSIIFVESLSMNGRHMPKKEITAELSQQIRDRFNELTKDAFSTEPAPRAEVEEALKRIYVSEGFEIPSKFIWVESDVAAAKYVKEHSGSPYNNSMFGQYDSFWVARIKVADEFVGGVIGSDDDRESIANMEVMTKCGPWWPYDNCVVIMDRPLELHLTKDGSPHNEVGPAIMYRDGVKHWYIGGHKVTEQIVLHPDTLTIEQIKAESNAEVRRVMISRYGVDKYLTATSANIIDKDTYHNHPRLLIELDDRSLWLVGTDGGSLDENGKGRVYHMPVGRGVRTCIKAHESICGFNEGKIGFQS